MITERQNAILKFIETFRAEKLYSPTIREIADEFGIKSPNAVAGHLKVLRKRGLVTWLDGQSRTLLVTRKKP